jgi:hypothetical protein
MAAIGKDQNTDTLQKFPELSIEFVIDEFAIVEAPGLILSIWFIAVQIWHLSAVTGVTQHEDIA